MGDCYDHILSTISDKLWSMIIINIYTALFFEITQSAFVTHKYKINNLQINKVEFMIQIKHTLKEIKTSIFLKHLEKMFPQLNMQYSDVI